MISMRAMDAGIFGPDVNGGVFLAIFGDPGIWGPVIYGAVFWGVFMILLGFIMYFVISRRRWAKKQARSMLENGQLDPATIEKTMKILGGRTKDMEAQSLFRKLFEIAEKE